MYIESQKKTGLFWRCQTRRYTDFPAGKAKPENAWRAYQVIQGRLGRGRSSRGPASWSMPAPSVLAKAAGVVGVSGWMRIHRLVDVKYDARFLRPLKVGDYIVVTVTVTAKRQHRKRNRNFGWVWVRQVIARADGKPCYIRKAMYAVLKKPLESS